MPGDAAARFIITADDKTKAAVQGALRGFKNMERGIKGSMGAIKASMGFFLGAQLTQSFQRILRATAESSAGQKGFAQALEGTKTAFEKLLIGESGLPQATKNLEEMQKVLTDPAIVEGADALTSALITGFTSVVGILAKTAGGLRQILIAFDLIEATTTQEQIDKLGRQIDDIREKRRDLQDSVWRFSSDKYKKQVAEQIEALNKEEAALEAAQTKLQEAPVKKPEPILTGAELEAQKKAAKKAAEEFKKQSDDITDYVRESSREAADAIDADYKDTEERRKESEKARAEDAERIKKENDDLADYIREQRDKEAEEDEKRNRERITTFTDAFKSAYDDLIRTGKFSTREFMQFLIAELARKEIFGAIDNIGKALDAALNPKATGSGGGGKKNFLGTLLSAGAAFLTGRGTIGTGISAQANNAVFEQLGPVAPLTGFQHGGAFRVPGSGGPDSQLVAFRASPGEHVAISPNAAGGSAAPHVVINNAVDARGASVDAVRALPEVLRRNNEHLEAKIVDGLRKRRYAI